MDRYTHQNNDSPLYITMIAVAIVYTWTDRWIVGSNYYLAYVYIGGVFAGLILWRFFYRLKKCRELCWAEILFPLLIIIWVISRQGSYYGWF